MTQRKHHFFWEFTTCMICECMLQTAKHSELHSQWSCMGLGSTQYGNPGTVICQSLTKMCGFPGSSAGKESTCHAGDLGLIPGLGRSLGKGIGYLLGYSWAFLVVFPRSNAQKQKVGKVGKVSTYNAENLVSIPVLELSPGEGNGYQSRVGKIPWRREGLPTPVEFLENSMDRGTWQAIVHGVTKSQTPLSNFQFHTFSNYILSHMCLIITATLLGK